MPDLLSPDQALKGPRQPKQAVLAVRITRMGLPAPSCTNRQRGREALRAIRYRALHTDGPSDLWHGECDKALVKAVMEEAHAND